MAKKPKKATKKTTEKTTKAKEEVKVEEKPKEPPKPKKIKSTSESKPKIEFNLSDGLTWHDFVGIFVIIGVIIWKILKIILYPVFWVYFQNVRLYRFIRASGHQRVMTEDEKLFFESVPIVFMSTGVIGGIIIGLLVALQVDIRLGDFFKNLSENLSAIFDPLTGFIGFLWNDVIIPIITFIVDIVEGFYNIFRDWYNQDPFFALIILVGLGIGIVLIWITIHEKFGMTIAQTAKRITEVIFAIPIRIKDWLFMNYRRINHSITAFLVGNQRLKTRTQEFFKRSLMYTSILTIWTFVAGIYINIKFFPEGDIANQVVFSAIVLLVAGFVCGTIIFALITRYFDLMNRQKYIAPEFIKAPRTATASPEEENIETDE